MKFIHLTVAVAFTTALVLSAPVAAQTFTTINLSNVVNGNIALNPDTFPTGTTTGNQGTNIPFNIATYGGVAGSWIADNVPGYGFGSSVSGVSLTVNLASNNISGAASFYALLNNYWGVAGANEYNITITATNNQFVTYSSIGGYDTRDYNNAQYTNAISNTTTEWFNNSAIEGDLYQRFDVREFTLPGYMAADTIASFTIAMTDSTEGPGYNMDTAVLSGLTFSTQPAETFPTAAPEPASLMLLAFGVAGLMGVRGKRRG